MTNMSSSISRHYNDMKRYDGVPLLSDDATQAMRLNCCIKVLQLNPEMHSIADIGAGSGAMGILLREKYPKAKKMVCVEPSNLLPQRSDHFIPTHMDALKFSRLEGTPVDACFIVQAMHHLIADGTAQDVLQNLHRNLSQEGRIVIVKRPSKSTHIPWFEAAHKTWNDHPTTEYMAMLREAGFQRVECYQAGLQHRIDKEQWYAMIRNRFFSNLTDFSDEDIEDGIKELEMGELRDINPVIVEDPHHFISGWK